MLWPTLTALVVVAAILLQVWWSGKVRQLNAEAERALKKVRDEQAQLSLQQQRQQEALFDSMAEGLLLLDEAGRVELANRAFHSLFGVTTDIRSRTIIEALRLHEL